MKRKTSTKALYVYVNEDTHTQVKEYAERFGFTMSQVSNFCIIAGMKQLKRAIEPEKVLDVGDWVKILQAAHDAGLDTDKLIDQYPLEVPVKQR